VLRDGLHARVALVELLLDNHVDDERPGQHVHPLVQRLDNGRIDRLNFRYERPRLVDDLGSRG
jgi:hypothetical protein